MSMLRAIARAGKLEDVVHEARIAGRSSTKFLAWETSRYGFGLCRVGFWEKSRAVVGKVPFRFRLSRSPICLKLSHPVTTQLPAATNLQKLVTR